MESEKPRESIKAEKNVAKSVATLKGDKDKEPLGSVGDIMTRFSWSHNWTRYSYDNIKCGLILSSVLIDLKCETASFFPHSSEPTYPIQKWSLSQWETRLFISIVGSKGSKALLRWELYSVHLNKWADLPPLNTAPYFAVSYCGGILIGADSSLSGIFYSWEG